MSNSDKCASTPSRRGCFTATGWVSNGKLDSRLNSNTYSELKIIIRHLFMFVSHSFVTLSLSRTSTQTAWALPLSTPPTWVDRTLSIASQNFELDQFCRHSMLLSYCLCAARTQTTHNTAVIFTEIIFISSKYCRTYFEFNPIPVR